MFRVRLLALARSVLTGVFAFDREKLVDLVANIALRSLDIVLGGAVIRHKGEEAVISNVKLKVE